MAMHNRRHPPTNPFTGRGLPTASPYRQADPDANAKSHSSSIHIMAKKAVLIVLSFVMFYKLFLGGDTNSPEVISVYGGAYKDRIDTSSSSGSGPVKLSVPEVESEVSYEKESNPYEKESLGETEPTEFRDGKLDEYSYKSEGRSGDDHQTTTTMATVDAEHNTGEYGEENSQDLSEKNSSNDVGNYDYNRADRSDVEKGTSSVEFGKDLDEKTQLVDDGHSEDNKGGSFDTEKLTEYSAKHSEDGSESKTSLLVGDESESKYDNEIDVGESHEKLSEYALQNSDEDESSLTPKTYDSDSKRDADEDGYHKELEQYSRKYNHDEDEAKLLDYARHSKAGESVSEKYDKDIDVGESHEKLSEYAQQHSDEDESSLTSMKHDLDSMRDADEDGHHKKLDESPKEYDDEETNTYRFKSKYDSDTHGDENLNEYAKPHNEDGEEALNSEKVNNPQLKYHKDVDVTETSSKQSEYNKTHDENSEDMSGSDKYRSSNAETVEVHSESKYESGYTDKLSEYVKSDNQDGEEAVSSGKQHEPESQYGKSVDEEETFQKDQSESSYKSESKDDEEPSPYRKDESSSEILLEMPIGDTEKATDEKTVDHTSHKIIDSEKSASEHEYDSEKLYSKSKSLRGDNKEAGPELVKDSYGRSTGNSEDGLKLENLSSKYRESIGDNATNDSEMTDAKSYDRDESDKKTGEYSIEESESPKKLLEADVKSYDRDESDKKTSEYSIEESESTKKSFKASESEKNTSYKSETIEMVNQETESDSVDSFNRESKYDKSNDSKRSSMPEDTETSLEGGSVKSSSKPEQEDGEGQEEAIKPLDVLSKESETDSENSDTDPSRSVIESDSRSKKLLKESDVEDAHDKLSLLGEKSDNDIHKEKESSEEIDHVELTASANDELIAVAKKGKASQIFDKIKSEVESGSFKMDTESIKSNSTIFDKGSDADRSTKKEESVTKIAEVISGEPDNEDLLEKSALDSKVVAGSIRGAALNDKVKSTSLEDDGGETSIGSGGLRRSKTIVADTIETKESSDSTSSHTEILEDEIEKIPGTVVKSDGLSSVEKEIHEESSESLSDKNSADENNLDKTEAALEIDERFQAKNSSVAEVYAESDAANKSSEKKAEKETASDESTVSNLLPENEESDESKVSSLRPENEESEKVEDSPVAGEDNDELKKVPKTDGDQSNHEAVSDADERVESKGQAADEVVLLESVESKKEVD